CLRLVAFGHLPRAVGLLIQRFLVPLFVDFFVAGSLAVFINELLEAGVLFAAICFIVGFAVEGVNDGLAVFVGYFDVLDLGLLTRARIYAIDRVLHRGFDFVALVVGVFIVLGVFIGVRFAVFAGGDDLGTAIGAA